MKKIYILIMIILFFISLNCYSQEQEVINKANAVTQLSHCEEAYSQVKHLITNKPLSGSESFDYKEYSNNLQKAESLLEQNIDKCNDNLNLNILMADVKMRLGKHEEASKYIEKALFLDSNSAMANYIAGEIHIQRNNHEKGLEYIKKSISIEPSNRYFLFNYCGYLEADGKYEESIEICTKVIDYDELEDILKGQIFYTRARAYEAKGMSEKAQQDYEQAKKLGYKLPLSVR